MKHRFNHWGHLSRLRYHSFSKWSSQPVGKKVVMVWLLFITCYCQVIRHIHLNSMSSNQKKCCPLSSLLSWVWHHPMKVTFGFLQGLFTRCQSFLFATGTKPCDISSCVINWTSCKYPCRHVLCFQKVVENLVKIFFFRGTLMLTLKNNTTDVSNFCFCWQGITCQDNLLFKAGKLINYPHMKSSP